MQNAKLGANEVCVSAGKVKKAGSRKKKIIIASVLAVVVAAVVATVIVLCNGINGNQNADIRLGQASLSKSDGILQPASYSVKGELANTLGVDESKLADGNKRVRIKTTIVDENAYNSADDKTIDGLMANQETAGAALLSQVESTAAIYDYGNNDYYAVKINSYERSGITDNKVRDIAFARDNYNGEVVDGIKYDNNIGIAYIPKALVDNYVANDESADQGNIMQAQMLYTAPSSLMSEKVATKATLTNTATGEQVQSYAGSEMWSQDTYVQLVDETDVDKVDWDSLKVSVNDGALSTGEGSQVETDVSNVSYNKSNGWVKIANTSAAIGNIDVSFKAAGATLKAASVQLSLIHI